MRKAFLAESSNENGVRSLQEQLQIRVPQKVTHLTFSSDGSSLVAALSDAGGLVAYDVAGLAQGNTQPAVMLPLNGATLRSLVPNPNPSFTELFAAITVRGELLVINMKEQKVVDGPHGLVHEVEVSSVSWSNLGKQLVAGRGNGTGVQQTPDGQVKAQLPRPPDLEGDQHGE